MEGWDNGDGVAEQNTASKKPEQWHSMEDWNDGILEGWNNEAGKEVPLSKFHYSNIPTFLYSNIPPFHYSNSPLFHHSTIPAFPSLWDDSENGG